MDDPWRQFQTPEGAGVPVGPVAQLSGWWRWIGTVAVLAVTGWVMFAMFWLALIGMHGIADAPADVWLGWAMVALFGAPVAGCYWMCVRTFHWWIAAALWIVLSVALTVFLS